MVMNVNEEVEIWKDIEGFEGKYQVSNMGKVRSLNYKRTGKVKELKPISDKAGYLYACLCKDGTWIRYAVHRLVGQAFLPNPNDLPVINHRDEIKQNNAASNLEWCTQKYNANYSLTWEKSVEVRRKPVLQFTKEGVLVAEYESARDAERQTGVNHVYISQCCLGK